MPDWVGTAIVGSIAGMLGCAFAWGSLRSEVSAQGTAQSVDASDIKRLISGQSEVKSAVIALTKDQEQLHYDLVLFMNANGRRLDYAPSPGKTR